MELYFTCHADNDLYWMLSELGHYYPRYDDFWDAVEEAPPGIGVLALADGYPKPIEHVSQALLDLAAEKGLRLYIEYPAELGRLRIGPPQPAQWERVAVSSDFFAGHGLPPGRLLALHGCWYVPMDAESPHLVLARAAGYRDLAFGLPDQAHPLLFNLGERVLVATSKLSQFITARYAPQGDWKALWSRLLSWLGDADEPPRLWWEPTVAPSYTARERLPDDAETIARERSTVWLKRHMLYSIGEKKGALEGFEGHLDTEGRQVPRAWPRSDCIAETAMALAYDWQATGNPDSKLRAAQIMDYVWSPDFYNQDPQSPAYGLVNWSERNPVFYGDDNARVILSTLAARRLLKETRWDEPVLRCLLANLRTTGKLGFRPNRIEAHQFGPDPEGWRQFQGQEVVSYAPHYQAYLWAAYLWAYALTGYEPFRQLPRQAIEMTMEAYPHGWRWTNGMSQEVARMLLPLAFLMRVEETPQHRQWLERMGHDLLALQQPCGAIREALGELAQAKYPPPQSNEAYGSTEASLIQADGDPVCDLLYTANYAFLGLHEAAPSLAALRAGEDRLADFFCRIQLRSQEHPYLHGAWMRAFDYQLWEPFGSSSDVGWGAWCVECGWTNTWINAVLAMRLSGATLFDTAMATPLAAAAPRLVEEMGLKRG